jgi:hypothetical protein
MHHWHPPHAPQYSLVTQDIRGRLLSSPILLSISPKFSPQPFLESTVPACSRAGLFLVAMHRFPDSPTSIANNPVAIRFSGSVSSCAILPIDGRYRVAIRPATSSVSHFAFFCGRTFHSRFHPRKRETNRGPGCISKHDTEGYQVWHCPNLRPPLTIALLQTLSTFRNRCKNCPRNSEPTSIFRNNR